VISSLEMARKVASRMNLINDPEFGKGAAKPGLTPEQKLDAVAGALASATNVSREKLTYILAIKVASLDPKKAALLANEFAAAYGHQGGHQHRHRFEAGRLFEAQLDRMGNEARAADEKVAQSAAQAGIVRSNAQNGETVTDQQVGPLALQMASAESVAAEARSKQISAQNQIANGQIDAVSDVRNSATVQDLRHQRTVLLQTLTEMQNRYGPRYPDYVKVSQQLAAVDGQLREEALRVVRSLKADADAAEARAGSLRATMQRLEDKQAADARASVTLQSLQRDADNKHSAYDRMAQTATDARQSAQNSIAQARIIDAAQVPTAPYSPRRGLLFGLSVLAGLAIGMIVITIQEMMVSGMLRPAGRGRARPAADRGSPDAARQHHARRHADREADFAACRSPAQRPCHDHGREGRTGAQGHRAHVFLPSEGKTTTALALARTMALNGQRTVILDVDVRRAQMRNIVDSDTSAPGTVELLNGTATLDQVLRDTRLENLKSISVSAPYFTSDNLFGTQTIHDIIDALSAQFDVIILDLPPLMGLADGRFLAALADAVVLAIRWNATPAPAVKSAVGWLRSDGANLVGAMYTMVDATSQSYGSYYYYTNKYTSYYSNQGS
jgi:capsular exopolysaccharide synthesis family protein